MTLEIKVDPELLKNLIEEARQVPKIRIDQMIKKIDALEDNVSTWKGDSKLAHDEACVHFRKSLEDSKFLMNAILIELDRAIDDFTELDEEISETFKRAVHHYTST